MDEQGRLLRCYTQNIDNLEELVGLSTSFLEVEKVPRKRKSDVVSACSDIGLQAQPGKDSCFVDIQTKSSNHRSEFSDLDDLVIGCGKVSGSYSFDITTDTNSKKISSKDFIHNTEAESEEKIKNQTPAETPPTQPNTPYENSTNLSNKKRKLKRSVSEIDKTFTKAVQLHGSLEKVTCTFCHTKYAFSEDLMEKFSNGEIVPCEKCTVTDEKRFDDGKRALGVGVLRPDIVLYNELHPNAEVIGRFTQHDLRRKPDLLIVMGTSLKIPGVKRLVREISKVVSASAHGVHKSGSAKSIFINRGPPSGFSSWETIFDYFVDGTSDEAVKLLNYTVNFDSLPLSILLKKEIDSLDKGQPAAFGLSKMKKENGILKSSHIVGINNNCSEPCNNAEWTSFKNSPESSKLFTDTCTPFIKTKTPKKKNKPQLNNENNEPAQDDYIPEVLEDNATSKSKELLDNIYYRLFSDPSTLTDISSSDIEGFSDGSFDFDDETINEVQNIACRNICNEFGTGRSVVADGESNSCSSQETPFKACEKSLEYISSSRMNNSISTLVGEDILPLDAMSFDKDYLGECISLVSGSPRKECETQQ